MSEVANIEVKYVNPRDGNRPPSIKDSYGNYYTVPDPAIGMFHQGMQCQIGYTVNGKYKNLVSVNGQPLQATNRAPVQNTLQQPAPSPQMMPQQNDKEEGMFVMGVVGRAMGSGQFGANDIALLTKAAVDAWRGRHGTYPERTQTDQRGPPSDEPPPFDDDIPWDR